MKPPSDNESAQTEHPSAADFLPARRNLSALRLAAALCQGCELFRNAAQTVFGKGSATAALMLVGEQPGDYEDQVGEPFVGPAGKLLNKIMEDAQIDRRKVYLTNAVKHFKWTPRGKRRLHAKPSAREVSACRPWLAAEVEAVKPKLIVCLGATAAQAIVGAAFRLTQARGTIVDSLLGPPAMATYHPSAILRAPDDERRQELRDLLLTDMRAAARWLDASTTG